MKRIKPKHNDMVHAALDRAYITSCHLQVALEEHEIVKKYADVQKAYDKAMGAIVELYQTIGQKFKV